MSLIKRYKEIKIGISEATYKVPTYTFSKAHYEKMKSDGVDIRGASLHQTMGPNYSSHILIHGNTKQPHVAYNKKTNKELTPKEVKKYFSEAVEYLDEVHHFVSQLRKVMDTEGQHVVKFKDGSQYKVNPEHALRALSLHDSLINHTQRNHYIKRISNSKNDFRKSMAGKKF